MALCVSCHVEHDPVTNTTITTDFVYLGMDHDNWIFKSVDNVMDVRVSSIDYPEFEPPFEPSNGIHPYARFTFSYWEDTGITYVMFKHRNNIFKQIGDWEEGEFTLIETYIPSIYYIIRE